MGFVKIGSSSAEVADGSEIRETCESLGILIACQEGVCGTCEVRVVKGKENLTPPTEAEKVMGIDLKGGKRLSCQCRLKHGTVELTQDSL
ncbi:(2Fe-2S)-binding protein [Candidatus Pacearchaeota archaeon]|nr:(2Fe-2S)-binding protein [Candidatus Pacearchaeota archaeon]